MKRGEVFINVPFSLTHLSYNSPSPFEYPQIQPLKRSTTIYHKPSESHHAQTMKLLAVLPAIIITASAWQVRFVGQDGHYIDTHGTQDTSCHALTWEPRQNVKLISFNPATDYYPDPEHVYVYSDGACGNNGLTIVPGDSPVDTLVGSYIVE